MQNAARPSNELPGGLAHWTCTSDLVRAVSGRYGRSDPTPMLAAVAARSIPAILILPRVDATGRPADPADWYAGLTGSRHAELIDAG
jgi:hypothetical protein